jgi:PPOX class probable F420-dependent enzyme
MQEAEVRRRFSHSRVARMSSADTGGRPHIIPVVFAVDGDRIYSIVDAKPKRSPRLKRLANVAANPHVSLVVDHYAEDWATIWWARADGVAQVVDYGPLRDRAIELLCRKYAQYRDPAMTFGPAVVITVNRWRGWAAG